MKKFEVANVNCQNCANTIKGSLEDEFGEILVDFDQTPRVLSVNIKDSEVEKFKIELSDLGFDVIREL
ncbi:heavy metal transport/detoxification protein [Campylobacter sp. 19-13652]|uniref:heavy metal transport/detoxification protein n=1 Tax=Campylobacter sp. 19-13652 TaxID=2840180 RepID=UPI001C797223|nr:heavy metal transport/detoxification protein [Campylobacter sp. 19-13652]BCX79899.1 hypothetical protein LBC_13610 [Campylobacter sp. 19-13652]